MKKLRYGSIIAFLSLIILINVNGQSLIKDALEGNMSPTSKEKAGTNDLERLLFELPDVIFKKLEPSPGVPSAYLIKIKQAIDHDDESKGFFYQKVYLTHKGFDRPTLMITEGYHVRQNVYWDLAKMLNANQIIVEPRYYGESKPDSIVYRYLSFEQAAADCHYVQQLFSQIYKGKWISTGHSKGGVSAIVYRYFYPNDIDVCVAYVAPIMISNKDQRLTAFLDTVFSAECNDKIRSIQVRLLENRESILPLIELYALGAKHSFTDLTLIQAFEYAVLGYPSCLLEYNSCDEIPDNDESIENIVKHFLRVSKLHWFSDDFQNLFSSFFYQAAIEMGGYAYDTTGLADLLVAIPIYHFPYQLIAPEKSTIKYDGKLMNDVLEWLNSKGDRFIYLYGAMDYWTAGAVPPNNNVDSEWFFMKNKNHMSTNIFEMTDSERERFITTLEKWLSIEVEDIFAK